MTADRHLRLVTDDEAECDPLDPDVWRPGLTAARAALDVEPSPSPDISDDAGPPARHAGAFRRLPPAVADAWRVLRGDEDRP